MKPLDECGTTHSQALARCLCHRLRRSISGFRFKIDHLAINPADASALRFRMVIDRAPAPGLRIVRLPAISLGEMSLPRSNSCGQKFRKLQGGILVAMILRLCLPYICEHAPDSLCKIAALFFVESAHF